MPSLRRINAIMFKELRQLARDRITFAMIVMIPLIQLVLFGYAINTDVRQVPSAVVDLAGTAQSRQLIYDLEASQVMQFSHRFDSVVQAEQAMTSGVVAAVLVLPADFQRRLALRQQGVFIQPVAQWITDGSDPLLSSAVSALSQLPLTLQGIDSSNNPGAVMQVVRYFNPEQRTAVNIVPGLIAVILTMTMVLFTSAAVVREREQGNMEFLITTPMQPLELMLGKIVPYIAVGCIQTGIILGLGHLLFAVPLPLHWLSLLVVTLLFILASLTLGLIISTRATTQLQAMQMTVFILLPSILLSGFMFPYAAMPVAAQWLAEVLPATHFVRMIRAVVLRDAQWWTLSYDVAYLAGFTLVGLIIATLRFKKRLD